MEQKREMKCWHFELLRRALGILALALLVGFGTAATASAANLCTGGVPDGLETGAEECDDNDADNSDFCLDTCEDAHCGDGEQCVGASCSSSPALSGPEACDDGNIIPGDGCSSTCTIEVCGNNVIDAGEDCDEGVNLPTANCDVDCTFSGCGDGVVNPETASPAGGEVCDDGPLNGTGEGLCLGNCAGLQACGDGAWEGSEECDSASLPTASCNVDCTISTCGDGIVNPNENVPAGGEVCDDGNNISGDGCRGDCASDETCGNGVGDPGEACESTSLPTATCDTDCTAAICGDGVVNPETASPAGGEVCDDGPLNGTADGLCLGNCAGVQTCGDSITNGTEQCDDGDLENGDGCDNNCTTTACGNGEVNPNWEVCDDGNSNNLDGCTNDCLSTNGCGDGVINALFGEECDPIAGVPTAGCDVDCTFTACGDGIVNPVVEACDDGNTVSGDGCRGDCLSDETCPNGRTDVGEECDDNGESTTCNADCTDWECGDGITNVTAGESCDDGNTVSGDGCRSDCVIESCGDGILQAALGEQCDDGVLPSAAPNNSDTTPNACRTNCLLPFCGDGVQDSGEYCDDANNDPTDGCVNIDIHGDGINELECVLPTCGDGRVQVTPSTEECDLGSVCLGIFGATENHNSQCLTNDDCGGYDGPGGMVPGSCVPIMTLGLPNLCRPNCTNPSCGDGIVDIGEECDDGLYFPPLFTGGNTGGPGACRANCTIPVCGDGVVDDGFPHGVVESCDDEGESALCNDDCSFHFCPDGKHNPTAGEACDDGGGNGDGCNNDCEVESCGDGSVDAGLGEQCDFGDLINGDGCDAACQWEVCTDGIVTLDEECDIHPPAAGDGCEPGCVNAVCGDGAVCTDADTCTSGPAGGIEECDQGVGLNSDTIPNRCRTNCASPSCGDAVTDGGETCDDAGDSATCDEDCTSASCGDGYVNAAAGEECDNAGANSNGTPDACRATGPNACLLPTCGDNTTDSDEQCDGEADCSAYCCLKGEAPATPLIAVDACQCELAEMEAACDVSTCKGGKKAKSFNKKFDKIERKLDDAEGFLSINELKKAEKKTRQAMKIASRLPKQASRGCTEQFECLSMHSTTTVDCTQEADARILEAMIPTP